jgi:hypothetical protein
VNDIFAGLVRSYSPPALLQELVHQRAKLRVVHRKSASGAVAVLETVDPVRLMPGPEKSTVAIGLDDKVRVSDVQIDTAGARLGYRVSGYGSRVAVSPPPPNELAGSRPSVPRLTGTYQVVRAGFDDGVAWKLLRAPAADGLECWRWSASAPLHVHVPSLPDGARCMVPPVPGASVDDAFVFLITSTGQDAYDAVAMQVPASARGAILGFVGGATQRASFGASPWVWVGRTTPRLAYIGVTLADGSKVTCGLGAVGGLDDLTDATVTGRLAGEPWSCQPA